MQILLSHSCDAQPTEDFAEGELQSPGGHTSAALSTMFDARTKKIIHYSFLKMFLKMPV